MHVAAAFVHAAAAACGGGAVACVLRQRRHGGGAAVAAALGPDAVSQARSFPKSHLQPAPITSFEAAHEADGLLIELLVTCAHRLPRSAVPPSAAAPAAASSASPSPAYFSVETRAIPSSANKTTAGGQTFTRRSAAVLPRTAGLRTARRTAGLSRPREPELSESAGLQIQIGEAPGTAYAAV